MIRVKVAPNELADKLAPQITLGSEIPRYTNEFNGQGRNV